MITFALGASAAIVVGVIVWLVFVAISLIKQVKHLEEEIRIIWVDVERRGNTLERELHQSSQEVHTRIDETYKYVDSRHDKLINHIEREYVSKKNRMDNSIDYNN